MPEIISKYPEIVLQILQEANIQCGVGEKQQILTACPKEKFCSFPTGEMCVYGINDISKVTQIHYFDLFQPTKILIPSIAFSVIILSVGILIGIKIGKPRK